VTSLTAVAALFGVACGLDSSSEGVQDFDTQGHLTLGYLQHLLQD